MNENMTNVEVINPKKNGLFTNYIYRAIPLAFDESMSYYETLCGLLSYLKDTVIPTVNNNANAMIELQNLYIQLKQYVDDYFTNLNVQNEINNKLDALVADGTLTTLIGNYIQPLIDIQNTKINEINNKVNNVASGSPLVASNVSDMINTSRIYVNTSDGNWYYYNGTSWVIGGVYQATGINNQSISSNKLQPNILKGQNMNYLPSKYNMNTTKNVDSNNYSLFSSGLVGPSTGDRLTTFNYLQFTKNPVFKPITNNINFFVNYYKQISRQANSFDFKTLNLELGTLNAAGNPVNGVYQLRTTDFIQVESNTLFEPDCNNYLSYVFKYEDNNFIERITIDGNNQTTYTFEPTYKYKLVFQCNISTYPITDKIEFYINSIKNSILTEMMGQITSGWNDYTLTHTNDNYLYKVCARKKNVSPFMTTETLNDYILISDDLSTPLQNKTISVLGDSFSAFTGIIPSTNVAYYLGNNAGVTNYNQMWWQRLINNNGANRGVIQASSGSNVSYIRNQSLALSNTNMCENLGTPDIIVILAGTNDFSRTPALLGTYDGTTNFPTTNNNFSDAYALMLSRLTAKYPNATIFCCSLPCFVRTNTNKAQPEQNTETNGEHKTIADYNNRIKTISEIFNCQYIDLTECGWNRENYYNTYCQDSSTSPTHPNSLGQNVIYKTIENKILKVLNNLY